MQVEISNNIVLSFQSPLFLVVINLKRKIGLSGLIALLSTFPIWLGRFLYYFYFGPPLNVDGRLVTPVGNPLIEWMFFTAPFIVFLVAFALQLSSARDRRR
ncbi:MAG: hypothetical protein ACW99U_01860 [Candidatus Thorarchaeota archaeon]|jgi:hypothetical protein